MNLSPSQKLIIAIVLIAVVAAAALFLLIVPKFTQMATLDDQIAQAADEIDSARSLLSQRQEVKARSPQTEAQLLALANQLPESPEMPGLIIELQDTVNTSGMEFISIQPGEPEAIEGGYTAIASEMVVIGRWQDCVDLLQRLRRITRQIRILEFRVEVFEDDDPDADATDTDKPTEVQATIVVEVYTMAQSSEASATVPAPSE